MKCPTFYDVLVEWRAHNSLACDAIKSSFEAKVFLNGAQLSLEKLEFSLD